MLRLVGLAAFGVALSGAPAAALCIHDGELYAETTIPQEFEESLLVVRGAALDKQNFYAADDAPAGQESGAKYRIRVDAVLKGEAPANLDLFTEINSGQFPIRVGPDYLLFLNPVPEAYSANAAAHGAWWVNYSCGQSVPWNDLSAEEIDALTVLATQSLE